LALIVERDRWRLFCNLVAESFERLGVHQRLELGCADQVRNAVYQLAALTIGARLAVADG
jgi:hypothetical protein